MEKYKIVFCGELQEGHDMLSVKSRLAALFKVRGIMVDKLFQGTPVLVRTDLSLDVALAFKKEFERTGALCQMLDVSAQPQLPVVVKSDKIPVNKGLEIPLAADNPDLFPTTPSSPPSPPPPSPSSSSFSDPSAVPVNRQVAYYQSGGVKKKSSNSIVFVVGAIMLGAVIFFGLLKKDGSVSPGNQPGGIGNPGASTSSSHSNLLSENTVPFNDPNNYYSVNLPKGYRVENRSSGQRSKIAFNYSANINVTIIASPMNKPWDPQASMDDRVNALQGGRGGELSGYNIDDYGLVNINGMDGYEIILSKSNQLLHAYAMVSGNNIAFSVAIVCIGSNWKENHDILDKAIRDSLYYQ